MNSKTVDRKVDLNFQISLFEFIFPIIIRKGVHVFYIIHTLFLCSKTDRINSKFCFPLTFITDFVDSLTATPRNLNICLA